VNSYWTTIISSSYCVSLQLSEWRTISENGTSDDTVVWGHWTSHGWQGLLFVRF
jgi:hypothetical protein